MSKRPKVTTLEATAYHEAAHAFVCVERRLPFEYVTIEEFADSVGHIHATAWEQLIPADCSRITPKLESYVTMVMAGGIVESILTGRRNHVGASGDYQQAIDTAGVAFEEFDSEGKVCTAYLAYIETYLRTWLQPVDGWEHSPWVKVTAIANALLEKKTLSAKMVREIVAGKHRRAEIAA